MKLIFCKLTFRYQVISVIPKTIEDFEMLKTLQDNPYLDFWTEIGLNRPVDIMVVPHFRFEFVEILKMQGIENSLLIPNVQYLINEERAAGEERRKNNDNRQMTWTDYYNISEVKTCNLCKRHLNSINFTLGANV